MVFVADGINGLIGFEIQHQVLVKVSRSELLASRQLQLLAKLGERVDWKSFLVGLQDVDVAVGIDELIDGLTLCVNHPLRFLRGEDFIGLGARCGLQSRK
jgi:hypothetical protein